MKKEFLEALEKELKKHTQNDDRVQELLANYREAIEFKQKAGQDLESIIKSFGSIKEIVADFLNIDDFMVEFTDIQSTYKMNLSTINADILIYFHNLNKIIIQGERIDKRDKYEISFNDDVLIVKRNKLNRYLYAKTKRRGLFSIYLPDNKVIEEAEIDTVSADIKFNQMSCNSLNLNTITGDIEINRLNATNFTLKNVSGCVFIENLITDQAKINTVNGKIEIDYIDGIKTSLSTVTGNITINDSNDGLIQTNSVTGTILIKGTTDVKKVKVDAIKTDLKDLGNKIKNIFK